MARKAKASTLPTREQLLAFIQENPHAVSRREITRAFHIAPADRHDLTALMRELIEDGTVERGGKRRVGTVGALPEVTAIEMTGTDEDGDVLARPAEWRAEAPPPTIRVVEDRGGRASGPGDRALARLRRLDDGTYEARIIRRLPPRPRDVLGVFRDGRVLPTDRRIKVEYQVTESDTAGAHDGELVMAQPFENMNRARIAHRYGDAAAPGAVSLIAIHENRIPYAFPQAAIAEAEAARPAPMERRDDLRPIPLVTIDDEDARDFDDAVFAEPDTDEKNPGGFHLVVAIADVAYYVRPGSALDREARARGNSVYFPDRVVPMLPEQLSNDLCSLRPNEDRACLAVDLWIDARGRKLRHRFVRGLMRSSARLTYRQVEDERARHPNLYAAYEALRTARRDRGTLDLDLPERRIVMNAQGRIERIFPRPRYDSHRLIEEFMILANVAAAEALEARGQPAMYRVHDAPSPEKLEALRGFLAGIGFALAKGQVPRASAFEKILARAAETPHARVVNEMILRSQAQAIYDPNNIGHFGLALRRYCHFTSPIRRYADLIVHRALITAFGLGEDGLPAGADPAGFAALAAHVSVTERRAAKAERDTADRLVAAFLSQAVGATFPGRIQGVTRFGLFVHLEETGADGLLPISTLGTERFRLDEARHTLTGERTRTVYALGDDLEVRLAEANPLTGGIVFTLVGASSRVAARGGEPRSSRPGQRKPPRRKSIKR